MFNTALQTKNNNIILVTVENTDEYYNNAIINREETICPIGNPVISKESDGTLVHYETQGKFMIHTP